MLNIVNDKVLIEIAQKYNRSVGHVILRWLTQRGIVALPKSSSELRMRNNIDVFDFILSPEDIAAINELDKHQGSVGAPGDGAPWEQIA